MFRLCAVSDITNACWSLTMNYVQVFLFEWLVNIYFYYSNPFYTLYICRYKHQPSGMLPILLRKFIICYLVFFFFKIFYKRPALPATWFLCTKIVLLSVWRSWWKHMWHSPGCKHGACYCDHQLTACFIMDARWETFRKCKALSRRALNQFLKFSNSSHDCDEKRA